MLFIGKKRFLPFSRPVALQFLVNQLHIFPLNEAFVRAKTPREAAGNVHEFMNQRSLFIFRGHHVKNLGDNLDGVGRRKVQHALPNLAQPVDSCDCAPCLGAFASHAENELGHHMVELAFLC